MSKNNVQNIAKLNDLLRTQFIGGQILMTVGIQALSEEIRNEVIKQIRAYSTWDSENDPYGEHDFGMVEVENHKVFWKIDYYDMNMQYRSEDPADSGKTNRVMTVMLVSEY